MSIQARWNGAVLAESDHTVLVEGNHYFPPADVNAELLQVSDTSTHCTWKGDASYYHLLVNGRSNNDAAWFYPQPDDAAATIKGYIAFWHGVEISGTNLNAPEIQPPQRSRTPDNTLPSVTPTGPTPASASAALLR
jgi:uncharacterized protein (DUF427 family)